jgi:pilus assembly protein Flp/PilA
MQPFGPAKGVPSGTSETRIDAVRRGGDGQGLAEYALILALIAIVVIIALQFLGGSITTILSTVGNSV